MDLLLGTAKTLSKLHHSQSLTLPIIDSASSRLCPFRGVRAALWPEGFATLSCIFPLYLSLAKWLMSPLSCPSIYFPEWTQHPNTDCSRSQFLNCSSFLFPIQPVNTVRIILPKIHPLSFLFCSLSFNNQMFKLVLEKSKKREIKLPTSTGSSKKQENSRKTSISALLTMSKPLTVWITTNCGKFWKRWEYQTTWPASWETYIQVRKQQLELDMEQQTGSK